MHTYILLNAHTYIHTLNNYCLANNAANYNYVAMTMNFKVVMIVSKVPSIGFPIQDNIIAFQR